MRHLTKEEKNSTDEIIPVARNEKESYFKSGRVRATDQTHWNIKIRFFQQQRSTQQRYNITPRSQHKSAI